MDNQKKPNEGQLQVELSPAVAEGTYANLAILSHSHAEFIADFARVMPGMPKAPASLELSNCPSRSSRVLAMVLAERPCPSNGRALLRTLKRQTSETWSFGCLPFFMGLRRLVSLSVGSTVELSARSEQGGSCAECFRRRDACVPYTSSA